MSTKEKTDPGLAIIKRAMDAMNDPTADARLAAKEEAKEFRQTLVLVGRKAVNKPDEAHKEFLLRDLSDLRWYLSARKAVETDDGLGIELKIGDESKAVVVQWHTDQGEVRFSSADDAEVAKTNEDGVLSTLTVEDVLAKLSRAGS